jgi:hypothetical protein
MKEIAESLSGLALGAPQVHLNLSVFPLIAESDDAPGYVLLDDALEKDLARVTEVSGAGSVPELAFENSSAERILLVDGDQLIGAKQNRIVNISILVGAGKRIVIPVSCVEQGRWRYKSHNFSSSNSALFAKARASKMSQVSASLRSTGARSSNQGEIWAAVAEKASTLGHMSETMAMEDLYERRTNDLADYARSFRAEPRQRGAVVAIDGRIAGMELFDSASAFARYFEKLVRSYAMDAVETKKDKPVVAAEQDVRRFLESLKLATAERFAALGEGEDIRLSGDRIEGGALMAEGRVVHLAGYAKQ